MRQREFGAFRNVRRPVSRALTRTIAGLVAIGLGFGAGQAAAARHAGHHIRHRIAAFAPGPVRESILIDAQTGQVLSESNADAQTYPASLTKMMTLYLTFKALNEGRLRLDTRLPVSVWAANQSPTRLGLRADDTVSVRSLILGIVTRSANDAAVVLAEGLAGSEPAFADRMNAEARRLGMTHTFFKNASGLPDPEQQTTARDIAQLALALYRDFPREYAFFATKEFNFRGTEIVGHDHLLNWYPGVDGIKTGYIRASGYNLATSAVRNGHRLIGVVLGGPTWGARDREMAALLDQGFAELGAPTGAVARVEPPPSAPPRPVPIPAVARAAAPAPASFAAPRRFAAAKDSAPPRQPARKIAGAAVRFAARLSPVGRAEAAPVPRPEPIPAARLAR
ncbi:MAG TPA: D-alanyl-D-alanine carboxypeptidase family protein, partial [Stellaceae bacterium]|nr:D-alanyl-D-alanine carboxypeptidase family protein [Stellaceae bacterium]